MNGEAWAEHMAAGGLSGMAGAVLAKVDWESRPGIMMAQINTDTTNSWKGDTVKAMPTILMSKDPGKIHYNSYIFTITCHLHHPGHCFFNYSCFVPLDAFGVHSSA